MSPESRGRRFPPSEYRGALGEIASRLGGVHPLTVSPARATDILWFYLGHQAWHVCVAEQGWSWDEAEAWLAAQVVAALVAPRWRAGGEPL